jgi:SWIM zinc finger
MRTPSTIALTPTWRVAAAAALEAIDQAARIKSANYLAHIVLAAQRGPRLQFEVKGTQSYAVEIRFGGSDGTCRHTCTCPAHTRATCKHIAAVLTALLADSSPTFALQVSPQLALAEFVAGCAEVPLTTVLARLALWLGAPLVAQQYAISAAEDLREFLHATESGKQLFDHLLTNLPALLPAMDVACQAARAWPGTLRVADGGPCARDIRRLTRLIQQVEHELPREDGLVVPPTNAAFRAEALTHIDGFHVSIAHAECMDSFSVHFPRGRGELVLEHHAGASTRRRASKLDLQQFDALKWLLGELANSESDVHTKVRNWTESPGWTRCIDRLESTKYVSEAVVDRIFALVLRDSANGIELQCNERSERHRSGWKPVSFAELTHANEEAARLVGLFTPAHLSNQKQLLLREFSHQLPLLATTLQKV